LKLRGIIYVGHGHFTCQIVSNNRAIWFNDGIATGRQCILEGNINNLADMNGLSTCRGGSGSQRYTRWRVQLDRRKINIRSDPLTYSDYNVVHSFSYARHSGY
ncbi:hypothetical protein C8F04DRAFT_966383, partial [Mycena alexandri]